jgi:large subunit ribosomal protein L23
MKSNNSLLIKKPWISEKSTDLSSLRKYVFLVLPEANSHEIKQIVEKMYSVHVVKTNIVNIKKGGKDMKKVIVTLKKGEVIDIVPH